MGQLSGRPTYYPRQRDPAWEDEIDIYILYSFLCLWLIYALVIPRYIVERKKWNWIKFLGGTIMILIGTFIMYGLYALHWETAHIEVENYSFTYFSKQTANIDIALYIGLEGFNVTVKGLPEYQIGQRINMNEQFRWGGNGAQGRAEWAQGRFCLSAGCSNSIARTFWRQIFRGVPRPILDVAEWFLIDGEYIRWAREYRIAGYYSWVFLWVGMIAWTCTNIVWWIADDKKHWAYGCWVTGLNMLCAASVWGARAPKDLYIPFGEAGQLNTHYDWTFYCNLIFGLLLFPMGAYLYWPAMAIRHGYVDLSAERPLTKKEMLGHFGASGAQVSNPVHKGPGIEMTGQVVAGVPAMAAPKPSAASGGTKKSKKKSKKEDTEGYQAGDRIEARYAGAEEFFAGKVSQVNADGSMRITYDDGDVEESVPSTYVRAPTEGEAEATVTVS